MATILIVDDDEDIVDVVTAMLAGQNEVIGTTDPGHALDILGNRQVDLMLTDIRMPQQNGFSLIEAARQKAPQLAVIVMSAYFDQVAEGTDDLARNLAHRYARCALAKPITKQTVNSAVAAILSARDRKKESEVAARLTAPPELVH